MEKMIHRIARRVSIRDVIRRKYEGVMTASMMNGMNQRKFQQFATAAAAQHPEPGRGRQKPRDDSGTNDAQ